MEILIILVLAAFAIYLLLKVSPLIYRLFYLWKTIPKIEAQYNGLLTRLNNDIDDAVKDYDKWKSGNKVISIFNSEDELKDRINETVASKKNTQEVNEKFIRLRERSVGNHKKLTDAIFWYKRYLDLRSKRFENRAILTVDKFMASANEFRIAIEESERRLDVLLDSNP